MEPLLLFAGTALLVGIVPGIGSLAYGVLAIYALRGPRRTIEAFTLLILLLLGNPIVGAEGGDVFRWAVFLAGFGRLVWDLRWRSDTGIPGEVVGSVSVFVLWSVVSALIVSAFPTISILKALTFGVGVFTILGCFYVTRRISPYWRNWFFTFFLFAVFASSAFFVAGLGYWRTQNGFQGIFGHPQILGPVAGIVGAWLTGRFLQGDRSPSLLLLGTLAGSWALVFLSNARTGFYAALIGLLSAILIHLVGNRKRQLLEGVSGSRVGILATALVVGLVVYGPTVQPAMTGFFEESTSRALTNPEDILQRSRGALMMSSMENFFDSPLAGIGFGIPSRAESAVKGFEGVERVYGIPVGASVEKGFMPTAMLEEVGLVGTALLLVFIVVLSWPVVQWGGIAINWMYWTTLAINGGAAVFFSLGGLGLIMWLLIGFCYSQSVARRDISNTEKLSVTQ